jgi:O-antigen ligase
MPGSLLLAKISLLGLLATFLPLFCGVRRRRLWLFAALLGFFTLLIVSALPVVSRSHGGFAGHVTLLAGGSLVGLALLAAVTWLVWRYPLYSIPAMVVLMPLRIPVPAGGSTSYLLVPLYTLTLGVAIAEVVVRDRLHLYAWFRRDPTRVALAAVTAVAGVAAMWTGLPHASRATAYAAALVEMLAFFLPFAVVYYLVYRYVRSLADLKRVVVVIIGWGGALALLGLIQYATRTVLFNRAGILRDYRLEHSFRVNALFWDPNMFGRFLVVVIVLALVSVLAPLERRWRVPLLAVAALATAALVVTYSRSSWAALAAAAILFEWFWLGRRRGTVAVLVTVVLLTGGLYALESARHYARLETKVKLNTLYGWNKLAGGRVYLIESGWRMFREHPVGGVGLSGFPLAYPDYRLRRARPSLNENHTTPVTVLAEEGLVGFAAYIALLAVYFATVMRSRALAADRRLRLVQAGFMAVILAIILHSLFYNAFFEDPYLWAVMAVSMALTYVVAQPREEYGAQSPTASASPLTPAADEISSPVTTSSRLSSPMTPGQRTSSS